MYYNKFVSSLQRRLTPSTFVVSEYIENKNAQWLAKFSSVGNIKFWCSQPNAQKEGEWIQVDLGHIREIHGIAVKVSYWLQTYRFNSFKIKEN